MLKEDNTINAPKDVEVANHFMSSEDVQFPHSSPLAIQRLRIGLGLLMVLDIAGFGVFIAYYIKMSTFVGAIYTYSCPATALWMGLGCFWMCTLQLFSWAIFREASRSYHSFWIVCNICFSVMGFICLVSFAASKAEGEGAGASVLWIISGYVGAVNSYLWQREINSTSGKMKADRSCCQNCCTCLMSWRAWLAGLGGLVLIFFGACVIGVTIQAAWAASDYNAVPPIGTLYTISVRGIELKMHLYCQGETPAGGKATMIFEHGGGANCLSLQGLADYFAKSRRTCVYDRLGYGWSPSLYTQRNQSEFAETGEILLTLLTVAKEPGPYVCVGHSAGARACLSFAMAAPGMVTGIVGLDGYPDMIRAGNFRPGGKADGAQAGFVLSGTLLFAVLAGPTGFTRNLVGNPGPDFVPQSKRQAVAALYAQSRFWLSQHWDVKADVGSGDSGYLYPQLGGIRDSRGVVTYGRTLPGTRILWIPSAAVNVTCTMTVKYDNYCCGAGMGTEECKNKEYDAALYLEQANLYAATLSSIPGKMRIAPPGSDHAFPAMAQYYLTIAEWIAEEFP